MPSDATSAVIVWHTATEPGGTEEARFAGLLLRRILTRDMREIAVENERTVDETLSILATTASADRSDHQQEYDQPWETGRA